jgi:membrane protein implicated in regulation of membrane protease activity
VGLLVVVLLIWAAVTGVLWSVLKVAVGVALGIFLGGALLAAAAYWGVRRALRPPRDRRY